MMRSLYVLAFLILPFTMLAKSVNPAAQVAPQTQVCHPAVDAVKPQYTVGYGSLMEDAYRDSHLDVTLMRACAADIRRLLCRDPSSALECLREHVAKVCALLCSGTGMYDIVQFRQVANIARHSSGTG